MVGSTALPASGPIKFSQIRKMYAGGTGATNNTFSYYYKGENTQDFGTAGSYPVVPNVGSSGNIPASGIVKFSQFRGTQKEYNVDAINANTKAYNHKTKFDQKFATSTTTTNKITIHGWADYGYFTRLTINSDKTVYSDNTGTSALDVGSHPSASTLQIDNEGNIYGMGGAGGATDTNGSAGGTALYARDSSGHVSVNNGGNIKGGGGGGAGGSNGGNGGNGGKGGNGGRGANGRKIVTRYYGGNKVITEDGGYGSNSYEAYWDGTLVASGDYPGGAPSLPYPYSTGSRRRDGNGNDDEYEIRRVFDESDAGMAKTGGGGGTAGAGGTGGTGGTGGVGGVGQHFTGSGNSDVNLNRTDGSSGNSGGSPGTGNNPGGATNYNLCNSGAGGAAGSSGSGGNGGNGSDGGAGGNYGYAGEDSLAGGDGSDGNAGTSGSAGSANSCGVTTGRGGGGSPGATTAGTSGTASKTGGAPGNSMIFSSVVNSYSVTGSTTTNNIRPVWIAN